MQSLLAPIRQSGDFTRFAIGPTIVHAAHFSDGEVVKGLPQTALPASFGSQAHFFFSQRLLAKWIRLALIEERTNRIGGFSYSLSNIGWSSPRRFHLVSNRLFFDSPRLLNDLHAD